MKPKILLSCIIAFTSLTLFGCFGDPNEKAYNSFLEARQILQTSISHDKNFTDIYNSYKKAKDRIDQVVKKYPSSNIATRLTSGETKIIDLTLSQFLDLEEALNLLRANEKISIENVQVLATYFNNSQLNSRVLYQIAGVQAELEFFDEALETTAAIEDADHRDQALAKIAREYSDKGQFEKSLEVSELILIEEIKSQILEYISRNYYALEKFTEALETANKIEDSKHKNEYLGQLAVMHANSGRVAEALDATRSIDDPRYYTKILLEIAEIQLKPYENEVRVIDGIRIEKSDSVFQATTSQAISAANMVKSRGYRCNSISKFKPLILSNGFHLICNNWQYEYELRDIGGNIRVIAK